MMMGGDHDIISMMSVVDISIMEGSFRVQRIAATQQQCEGLGRLLQRYNAPFLACSSAFSVPRMSVTTDMVNIECQLQQTWSVWNASDNRHGQL
jgi:hypothetical protein